MPNDERDRELREFNELLEKALGKEISVQELVRKSTEMPHGKDLLRFAKKYAKSLEEEIEREERGHQAVRRELKRVCTQCHGRGNWGGFTRRCDTCFGRGYTTTGIYSRYVCVNCRGAGKVTYPVERCPRCRGTGEESVSGGL